MQLEFRDVTINDRSIIEKYKKNWCIENAEMTFEHLYTWGGNSFAQIAEGFGCLYIKLMYTKDRALLMPPIPLDETVDYHTAVIKAKEYLENKNNPVVFYSICEPFVDMFKKYCPEFELTLMRDAWDYIYNSSDLITLKGKKYHAKRNFINRLKLNYPNFEYREITEADYDLCIGVYDQWHKEHEGKDIDQYDERGAVVRALKNLSELKLKGGAIFIDNKMVAFTIGGYVNSYMGHIHVEKAIDGIDGLYPAINQLFASQNYTDTLFINREDDMGLEGLRKAKESYYPVKMTEKYNAVLKNTCVCKTTICASNINNNNILCVK